MPSKICATPAQGGKSYLIWLKAAVKKEVAILYLDRELQTPLLVTIEDQVRRHVCYTRDLMMHLWWGCETHFRFGNGGT